MNDVSADSIDRFTDDALQVAISLDSFTTPDWAERLGPAIQQGNEQLAGLQQRRELLTAGRGDDALLHGARSRAALRVITDASAFLSLPAGNR